VGELDFKIKPHKSSFWILSAHSFEIFSSSRVTSFGFFVEVRILSSPFSS
jgi:hypothetical protein